MFIAAINSNRKEKTFCTETQTNKFERITCKYLQCKEETVAPIAIESEIILSKKAKKNKDEFLLSLEGNLYKFNFIFRNYSKHLFQKLFSNPIRMIHLSSN